MSRRAFSGSTKSYETCEVLQSRGDSKIVPCRSGQSPACEGAGRGSAAIRIAQSRNERAPGDCGAGRGGRRNHTAHGGKRHRQGRPRTTDSSMEPWRERPFVVVNCTTLADQGLESELFAH